MSFTSVALGAQELSAEWVTLCVYSTNAIFIIYLLLIIEYNRFVYPYKYTQIIQRKFFQYTTRNIVATHQKLLRI